MLYSVMSNDMWYEKTYIIRIGYDAVRFDEGDIDMRHVRYSASCQER